MKIYASEYKPKLVLNTGDNFYYCGIHNTSDPQVSADYVELFGNIGLPWYNTLGNHDYGFNPDAQLALNGQYRHGIWMRDIITRGFRLIPPATNR